MVIGIGVLGQFSLGHKSVENFIAKNLDHLGNIA